jgi:hypothetical protein
MAPGHHEPNIFDMRKKVDELTRQLANDKRALADREKLINRDSDDEAFAREIHATLCLSVTCQGWSDESVRKVWQSFAVGLLMPGSSKRLERSQLLDLAGEFASNPFYQSIRSAQQLLSDRPGDILDGLLDAPAAPALVADQEPPALFAEPEPGPAPASSQEATPATAAQPSSTLLELTDDDIPF